MMLRSSRYFQWVFLALLAGVPLLLNGQQYPGKHFSTGSGLSHANVFRIFQDHRGFIWMSTNSGLSRFDGKIFHNYYLKDGLTDNCIMSVSETPQGQLLICTYNGGLCIKNDTSITPYPLKNGHTPSRAYFAYALGQDIWLIGHDTSSSLYLISDSIIRRVPVYNAKGREISFYTGVHISKSELLLATSDGIYRVKNGHVPELYIHGFTEKVTVITPDKSGGLWAGTSGGILKISNGKIVRRVSVPQKSAVSDILVDRDNKVWVALLGDGVFILRNNMLESVNPLLNVSTTSINDMMEDGEGNLWIATHGQGAFLVNGQHIQYYPVEKDKLNVYCESISRYKDQLFIASIGTVSIWEDGKLIPFKVDLLNRSNYVYFARVYDSNLYIGTSLGLIVKDMEPPYREYYASLDGERANVGMISIFRDRDRQIWLGGYKRIYRYKDGVILADTNYKIAEDRRINVITQSKSGEIWIGTDKGIIINDSGSYKEWYGKLNRFPAFIQSLYEDSRGRMWIGSRHGLFSVDKDKDVITPVPMEKTDINDIREDKNNYLWLATGKGLKYIGPWNRRTEDYFTGTYNEEVSALYLQGDTIFAGTTAGLLFIRNNRFSTSNQKKLPVYITSATTGSQTLYMPTKITLPYKNNKLTISFTGLNFESPDKIEYRYRIEGLDNAWHITDNNSIELPALPDGSYKFFLQARNRQGPWTESVSLPLKIETPIWKNGWFYIIAVAAVSFLFYLIIKKIITSQEKQKRNRMQLYNKMAYLKQQALSALINPHFIFNCMNSIQHYLNEHDNDMANEYLSDFAGLIRMTMEHSTEAFIDLDKEIKRINLYISLEQLRFGEELRFTCVVDPSLDARKIRIPNMVLQPYLENAVWHGIMPKDGIGEIFMHVGLLNKDHLIITIQDDGVGIFSNTSSRNKNKKNALGMSLIRERMALLKKLLKQEYLVSARELRNDKTGEVEGTIVEIMVPLQPKEEVLERLETDNRE